MNYLGHIVTGTGSLCAFLLAADISGIAPAPAPVPLAAGLGMAALGAIAVDIDHPASLISLTPVRLFKLGVRLLIFTSIPAIATIASSRRVNLVEPGKLFHEDIFRLLVVVTMGAITFSILIRLIQGLFKHRGPIHSPAFWVGITIIVTVLLFLFVPGWWWMGLTFGWGWFSHIAADGLTSRGIPIFWPLTSERFRLLPGCLLAPARILVIILSSLSVVLLVARLINII
jgi:membrane-bound metal-dependent hydrolase YbcI (DUF457 family)